MNTESYTKNLTIPQAVQIATQALQNGQLQKAEQLCRQILKVSPNQADALHLLGMVAYHAKHHEEAIKLTQQAIKLNPEQLGAYYNLASIFQELTQYQQACHWYEKGFCRTFNLEPPVELDKIVTLLCTTSHWQNYKKYFVDYVECLKHCEKKNIPDRQSININNEFNFVLSTEGVIPIVRRSPITQKYVDWAKEHSSYLGTIPRSGTNLMEYFFDYYHLALLGQLDFNEPEKIDIAKGGWTANMQESLGFKWFLISHNNCPGFESLCDGELREKWNDTCLSGEQHYSDYNDINYVFLIERFRSILYPNLNKATRILFLYRNPLDHIVSYIRHQKNHLAASEVNDTNISKACIGSYLRMYISYAYMKKHYPDNIKFVSYEQLVGNISKTLQEILAYFKFDLSVGNRMALFEKTLTLVTPDALRKVELQTGKTLAKDQAVSSQQESHMRGGEVGKWKKHFSTEDIILFEKMFNNFDLSLNDFDGISIDFNKLRNES